MSPKEQAMKEPCALDDLAELNRRRALASSRSERESERGALLTQLIETARQTGQLRDWIVDQQRAAFELSPEYKRMLNWARIQLAELEAKINPARVTDTLREHNLFPEIDELTDPLGDPPPLRPWGR
jgi:hypothetical protein